VFTERNDGAKRRIVRTKGDREVKVEESEELSKVPNNPNGTKLHGSVKIRPDGRGLVDAEEDS
jgi:hypothetical protein